jgi:hypothetical protein
LWFKEHPDRLRAMGTAAEIRAKEFTWSRYAGRIIDIYKELSI